MITWGTSYFVNYHSACTYYAEQSQCSLKEAGALVKSKLADGDIHIGLPPTTPNQRVVLLDGGRRYGISDTMRRLRA